MLIKRLIGGLPAIDEGRGRVILFLHGYLCSKEIFVKQITFFSRFFRVVAVDMTGFGEAGEMKYPYSVGDYACEIGNVIDELCVSECDVLAHSFGARVAIKLAAEDKRIKRIIFTGAAGLKPRRGVKYLFKRASFLMLKKLVPKEKLKRFYSSDYLSLRGAARESFKLVISENLDETAKKLTNKTLILSGKNDKETPPYSQKKLNRYIENSELVFIRGGHFCFTENPEAFNFRAFKFLTEGR